MPLFGISTLLFYPAILVIMITFIMVNHWVILKIQPTMVDDEWNIESLECGGKPNAIEPPCGDGLNNPFLGWHFIDMVFGTLFGKGKQKTWFLRIVLIAMA